MPTMCSETFELQRFRKNGPFSKKFNFDRELYVKCLQSLEDLKETCDRLGLKFVDCTKSKRLLQVDMILDHKRNSSHSATKYLVKWKGFSSEFNSWEPKKHLFGCDDLIYFYRILNNPPENLNKKTIHCFIRDLVTFEPRDVLTLKKLCSLIYGCTEEFINSLELTFKELKMKAIKILDIPLKKLSRVQDELVKLMRFSQRRKYILIKIKEWEVEINEFNSPYVMVENNVDLEEPPVGFQFIQDYISPNIDLKEKPVVFCSCDNCYENRDYCCSKTLDGDFAYNKYQRLQLLPGYRIFECNELCKCSKDCVNRVVQHGQKIKVAIFRTANGCGWGLKTLEPIQRDQFVIEYLGEIITSDEAEDRGEIYDYLGHSYLFDLDCGENCLYTVDGGRMGNAAHFINHSCDPNMHVFTVWINQHNPNLPRLAFFAKRRINVGEELTFDYKMIDTRTKHGIPINDSDRILCKCGAKNCKKYLF